MLLYTFLKKAYVTVYILQKITTYTLCIYSDTLQLCFTAIISKQMQHKHKTVFNIKKKLSNYENI